MVTHIKTHGNNRKYNCDICIKLFTRKIDVVRYKRLLHTVVTKESFIDVSVIKVIGKISASTVTVLGKYIYTSFFPRT